MILGHNFPAVREKCHSCQRKRAEFWIAQKQRWNGRGYLRTHSHVEMVLAIPGRRLRAPFGRPEDLQEKIRSSIAGCYHGHSDALLVAQAPA